MRPIKRRDLLCFALVASLLPSSSGNADTALPKGRRVALSGYDPLTYFSDGEPEKGVEAFWFAFDDAVYLFKTAEHRAKFVTDPERYAPQYAGFCAGGISKGYKTEPDPQAWAIMNGKLFVFELKDRVPMFKQDAAFIESADRNWPRLKDAPIR